MRSDLKRKSAIALGVAVICRLFLLESSFAHRVTPNPASPFVGASLGLVRAEEF